MTKAAPPSTWPFQPLEREARRLQLLLLALIILVAVAPTVIFVSIELSEFRSHVRENAQHVAEIVEQQLRRDGPDLPAIVARVRLEMEEHHLRAVRLTSGRGRQLEIGDASRSIFPTAVTIRLGPDAAPFTAVTVNHSESNLIYRIVRVLAVHSIVALVLFAVYLAQTRAFRIAIQGVRNTYAQLVHSDKLSAIGEMYAALTHEINNPLAIILSRVRLLLRSAKERQLPADLVADLDIIDRHGTRIAEIIRGLLAFARRSTFDLTQTNLNAVIVDVIALIEDSFAKQGVRIERALDEEPVVIRGNHAQLQQVFMNLLNNARDAMPTGGTIWLRTHRSNGNAVAEVRDTGKGIPQDVRDRIFEPFFTTKEVGKGTGLGLSVSYGIMKGHGGDIEVESPREGGALFRLTFPAGA